jgi:hypothetical protein
MIEAHRERPLAVTFLAVSAQGDKLHAVNPHFTNSARRLEPVHAGHRDVEKDDVWLVLMHPFNCCWTIVGRRRVLPDGS